MAACPHPYTVVSVKPSALYALHQEKLYEVFHKHPKLQEVLVAEALSDTHASESHHIAGPIQHHERWMKVKGRPIRTKQLGPVIETGLTLDSDSAQQQLESFRNEASRQSLSPKIRSPKSQSSVDIAISARLAATQAAEFTATLLGGERSSVTSGRNSILRNSQRRLSSQPAHSPRTILLAQSESTSRMNISYASEASRRSSNLGHRSSVSSTGDCSADSMDPTFVAIQR